VEWNGLGIIVWLNAGLLAVGACVAWLVPNRVTGARLPEGSSAEPGSFRMLLRIPMFRRLMIVAALIGGGHALHDGFEVIRWRAAVCHLGKQAYYGPPLSQLRLLSSCFWDGGC
jgi:PPP family 3-phenylpropionic acid transporter